MSEPQQNKQDSTANTYILVLGIFVVVILTGVLAIGCLAAAILLFGVRLLP